MSGALEHGLQRLDSKLDQLERAPMWEKPERARGALLEARVLIGELVAKVSALEGGYTELSKKCQSLKPSGPSAA